MEESALASATQAILRRELQRRYSHNRILFFRLSILTVDLAIADVLRAASADLAREKWPQEVAHSAPRSLHAEELAQFWLDHFEEQVHAPRHSSPQADVAVIASRLAASIRFSLNQRVRRDNLRTQGAPPGVRSFPALASIEKDRGQEARDPACHPRAAEISARMRRELEALRLPPHGAPHGAPHGEQEREYKQER